MKLIGLQLDLARQIESPECIKGFFKFAAQSGYNAVFLYLEDRIRTKSYPHPSKEDSYEPEAMRSLVEFAGSLGLDVVPVVSTLGHVERFLRHPEMRHLAELREGVKPRSGNGWDVFCPTLEETYEFWRAYLAEISAIFPSKYLHIGCDEVWNLGLCSKCEEKMAAGRSAGDLFAYHVGRIRDIVAGLGRRPMMWDDMLEDYPEALAQIPRDIVQCVWQYDCVVDRTMNHFGHRSRDHRLGVYDEMGIDYVVTPTSWNISNAKTFTEYASNFKPLGALMSRWEGSFLSEDAAAIAFAGRLWSGRSRNADEAMDQAAELLLGSGDALAKAALLSRSNAKRWNLESRIAGFLGSPNSACANGRRHELKVSRLAIEASMKGVKSPLGREAMEDLLAIGDVEEAQFEIRDLAQSACCAWASGRKPSDADIKRLGELCGELEKASAYWKAKWERSRHGVRNCRGSHNVQIDKLKDEISSFADGFKGGGQPFAALLKVRYSLPDYYGWPFVRWQAKYAGATEWVEIYNANPKPSFRDYSDCPFFYVGTPLGEPRIPERLKIEYSGYCGIGLLHLEYFTGGKVFRPSAVEGADGIVDSPENVLIDDSRWCRMGESSSKGVFNASAKRRVHSFEILLSEGKSPLT